MEGTVNKWLHRPDQVWKPVFGARVAAELGTLAAATGIVPLVEAIAPERYDRLKQHFARAVVKPHADWLEQHLFTSPAFALASRKLKDVTDPDEKAHIMAGAIIDFAAQMVTGIAAQAAVQSSVGRMAGLPDLIDDPSRGYLNRRLQHTRNMVKPVLFDKAINMSLVALMQVGLPQTTKNITESTSTVLQKTLGVPPEATQYFVQWWMPHMAGFTGSAMALSSRYSNFLREAAAKNPATKG